MPAPALPTNASPVAPAGPTALPKPPAVAPRPVAPVAPPQPPVAAPLPAPIPQPASPAMQRAQSATQPVKPQAMGTSIAQLPKTDLTQARQSPAKAMSMAGGTSSISSNDQVSAGTPVSGSDMGTKAASEFLKKRATAFRQAETLSLVHRYGLSKVAAAGATILLRNSVKQAAQKPSKKGKRC